MHCPPAEAGSLGAGLWGWAESQRGEPSEDPVGPGLLRRPRVVTVTAPGSTDAASTRPSETALKLTSIYKPRKPPRAAFIRAGRWVRSPHQRRLDLEDTQYRGLLRTPQAPGGWGVQKQGRGKGPVAHSPGMCILPQLLPRQTEHECRSQKSQTAGKAAPSAWVADTPRPGLDGLLFPYGI